VNVWKRLRFPQRSRQGPTVNGRCRRKAAVILLSLGLLVTSVRMDLTFWRDSKAALVSNRCRTVFRQRTEMDHSSKLVLNAKRRML